MVDFIYKWIRRTLGGIFVYAGSTKLFEPETFAVLIDAYGIIPESLLMPVAIGLPALEVITGIGLFFDIKGSLSAIAVLLGLFVAILGYGIWMGLDIDCGCFMPEDPEAKAFHGLRLSLYRDFAMIAGIVFLYGWRRHRGIRPVNIWQLLLKKRLNQKRRAEDVCVQIHAKTDGDWCSHDRTCCSGNGGQQIRKRG